MISVWLAENWVLYTVTQSFLAKFLFAINNFGKKNYVERKRLVEIELCRMGDEKRKKN
jgi:hypothetical protein